MVWIFVSSHRIRGKVERNWTTLLFRGFANNPIMVKLAAASLPLNGWNRWRRGALMTTCRRKKPSFSGVSQDVCQSMSLASLLFEGPPPPVAEENDETICIRIESWMETTRHAVRGRGVNGQLKRAIMRCCIDLVSPYGNVAFCLLLFFIIILPSRCLAPFLFSTLRSDDDDEDDEWCVTGHMWDVGRPYGIERKKTVGEQVEADPV